MLMAVTKLIVLFIPFTTVSIINLYFLVENRFRRFHSPSLDMFKTSGCLDGTVKKFFKVLDFGFPRIYNPRYY